MSVDKVGIRFAMMRLRCDASGLDGVLGALGQAIRAVETRIDEIAEHAAPEDQDVLIGDACDMIESMLGTAFIACQTQMTGVISAGVQLAEELNSSKLGADVPSSKAAILAIGEQLPTVEGITQTALIDALANYFKHRDEWQGGWEDLSGRSAGTARVILAAGLSQGCTGNLRRGFEKLILNPHDELKTYGDVIRLSEVVSEWSEDVQRVYRTALGK